MDKYEIHISDIRSFKSCRRKWNWSSPLRRNLEKQIPYAPFFTGRGIHHCLEYYYRDSIPLHESLAEFLENEKETMQKVGELWPDEHRIMAEQTALMAQMLHHYSLWAGRYQGKWSDDKLEFIDMETMFHVPLYNDDGTENETVFLAGRFDGLVRRRDDGTYWLWETKTTRSIEEMVRSLDNDEQAGAYMYAAQETFGVHVSGVLYNLLRKKAPTVPDVLQSGLLTKRKSLDTTPYAYLDAAHAHHAEEIPDEEDRKAFIREEYGEILQHLLDKGNTFFGRIPIYRTPNEIRQLQKDLLAVSLEMVNESTAMYPAPSWMNCRFCHFRSPCLMMNSGGDVEFLLRNEYQEREPWQQFDEAKDPSEE